MRKAFAADYLHLAQDARWQGGCNTAETLQVAD